MESASFAEWRTCLVVEAALVLAALGWETWSGIRGARLRGGAAVGVPLYEE